MYTRFDHINALRAARTGGLLRSWREQHRIRYAIETKGIRQLMLFLTEDCCGGRPELCGYPTPAGACQEQESAS